MMERRVEPDRVLPYPLVGVSSSDDTDADRQQHHDGATSSTSAVVEGRLFVYEPSNAARAAAKGDHVVLLCPGFPDDQYAMSYLASRLAREAGCLCGVACLVGFDYNPDPGDGDVKQPHAAKKKREYKAGGYTLNEMVACLRNAARVLRLHHQSSRTIGQQSDDGKDEKEVTFTTMFHDWGCIVGSIYTNRAIEEN